MAELDVETFKNRLREVFREDSQEVTGKKIGVGQGNVSKLVSFSSSQLPRADTLFRIAEEYNVSIDWLLGVSEKKQIIKIADAVSYASAVRALVGLCQHQTAAVTDESGPGLAFKFDDPLIKFLVKKSLALSKTDTESYRNWIETRLVEFENKPLIFSGTWSDENIDFLVGEASVESEWLQIHNAAIAAEEEYAEMMGNDPGPFGEHHNFDAAGSITKNQDTPDSGTSSDFLTNGIPVSGQSRMCQYTIGSSRLKTGEVSVKSCTMQGLDNGYIRYSLAYNAPAGIRICVFNPPDGDRYKLLSTSVISGGQGVFQFDLKPEDVIGSMVVVNFFCSDADRCLISIQPTIPLWVSSGSETGVIWNPAVSTDSSFGEGECTIFNFAARELKNGCIRFDMDYVVPKGMNISIFNPPQGDRFIQLAAARTSGGKEHLVFDLPRSEVEGQSFTIKFYGNEAYFYVFVQGISNQ